MDPKGLKKYFDTLLDEKLVRLDDRTKVAILVASVALPLALFYFLLYSPKNEEITALEANKIRLEQDIAKLEAKARKLDEHRADKAEVDRKFRIASRLIPEKKEIPALLTSISGLATNSGLNVLAFTPQQEQPKDFYAEIPVDIQVNGTYHNFGHFFYQVSRMPRIALISDIDFSSPKLLSGEMQLDIKFDLKTYRSIEQKEANDTQK